MIALAAIGYGLSTALAIRALCIDSAPTFVVALIGMTVSGTVFGSLV